VLFADGLAGAGPQGQGGASLGGGAAAAEGGAQVLGCGEDERLEGVHGGGAGLGGMLAGGEQDPQGFPGTGPIKASQIVCHPFVTRTRHPSAAPSGRQRYGKWLGMAEFMGVVMALLTPGYDTSHDEYMDLERISVDHRVMGGVPCVAGTRIPVATVVGSVASGLTADEILAEYPQLTRDDIQACLAYAAGVADVRELPIRAYAARIHDLLAEAATAPLPEGTGLTEQRAEELISEIHASRETR
jgi:uncharacterized protein (DUF433 family)